MEGRGLVGRKPRAVEPYGSIAGIKKLSGISFLGPEFFIQIFKGGARRILLFLLLCPCPFVADHLLGAPAFPRAFGVGVAVLAAGFFDFSSAARLRGSEAEAAQIEALLP